MKKNLIVSVLMAATLLVSSAAFAQQAGPRGGAPGAAAGREQRAQGGMRMMQEAHEKALAGLNLNAGQKTKIAELDRKRNNDMKALREKGQTGNREAMRGEARKIQEEYRKGLQSVLTPAQWEQYQKSMAAAMKEAREKRGGPKGDKPAKGTKPSKP